jgi:hypothetical protein
MRARAISAATALPVSIQTRVAITRRIRMRAFWGIGVILLLLSVRRQVRYRVRCLGVQGTRWRRLLLRLGQSVRGHVGSTRGLLLPSNSSTADTLGAEYG